MVDVLKMNGGIPADLEDPECSHVVSVVVGVVLLVIVNRRGRRID